jgi:hypothetical protein
MSYDFGMKADLGNGDIYLWYNHNYTYNVSSMFYKAFGEEGIKFIENKTGKECLQKLRKGLKEMQDNKKIYEALNPDNGWGNYEGAIEVIETLIKWALESPKAKFYVE